tara:strand:+ start:1890 stop:3374 length:1485 start_codon:yes stop_codon:yes gene_type:complete
MIFEKQFDEICKLCDEILLSKNSTKEIIATSWLHVIREHSEFTNRYNVLFETKKNFFSLYLLKKLTLTILRIIKNFFFQKNQISFIGNYGQPDILIISHFLNINQTGKEEDFYFGHLPLELQKLNNNVVLGLINHTDENNKKIKSRWKIEPKIHRVIFGKNIKLKYELKIILDLLKNLIKINKLFYKSKGLKRNIYYQVKKELFSVDTINNLKIFYQVKELVKKHKPKIVMLIHEGHAHERIIFKSLREMDKNIKCVGYQHACIFKKQHSLKRNLSEDYNPDIILTSGEKPKKILEENFKKENVNIQQLGSHRFLKKKLLNFSIKENICLVIPEGLPKECKYLFDLTLMYSKKFKNMKFIWRLHPIITFEFLFKKKLIPNLIPKNIILSNNSLEEDIYNCKWALYRGTTAIFTAVANGVYPIYYNYNDTISTDPLYEVENRSSVKNINDLNIIFKNESNFLQIEKLNKSAEYCNKSFEKYNLKNLKEILNESKN